MSTKKLARFILKPHVFGSFNIILYLSFYNTSIILACYTMRSGLVNWRSLCRLPKNVRQLMNSKIQLNGKSIR
jgi:hypothetical protein